jgi:hypothetical protein
MNVAKLGVVVGDYYMNSMSQHERQYASKHGIAYVLAKWRLDCMLNKNGIFCNL